MDLLRLLTEIRLESFGSIFPGLGAFEEIYINLQMNQDDCGKRLSTKTPRRNKDGRSYTKRCSMQKLIKFEDNSRDCVTLRSENLEEVAACSVMLRTYATFRNNIRMAIPWEFCKIVRVLTHKGADNPVRVSRVFLPRRRGEYAIIRSTSFTTDVHIDISLTSDGSIAGAAGASIAKVFSF